MNSAVNPSVVQADTSTQTKTLLPIELTDANFDSEIKEGLTFVDFWAPWCGPCRFVSPMIEELSKQWTGKIKFAKVNTDENPQISMRFDIRSIPSFIMFADGKQVDFLMGALPKQVFAECLNKNFENYQESKQNPTS